MGKAKGKGSACLDYKKEGRNYCSGKNKAFTVDESSLGGEEKSKREEVNVIRRWLALRKGMRPATLQVGCRDADLHLRNHRPNQTGSHLRG